MDADFLKFDSRLVAGRLEAEDPSTAPKANFSGGCFVGAFSYIGMNSIVKRTRIGRYCSLAQNINLGLFNHPISGLSSHPFAYMSPGPFNSSKSMRMLLHSEGIPQADGLPTADKKLNITIGNDVWLGYGVSVLCGVTIGDGAVVAAGAVVTKNVRPYEIVGGLPAKHIRMRFAQEIADRLCISRWWEYDLSHPAVVELDKSDIGACLDPLEKLLLSGDVPKASFKTHRIPDKRSLQKTASTA